MPRSIKEQVRESTEDASCWYVNNVTAVYNSDLFRASSRVLLEEGPQCSILPILVILLFKTSVSIVRDNASRRSKGGEVDHRLV